MNASLFCFVLAWVLLLLQVYKTYSPKRDPAKFWLWVSSATLCVIFFIWWARPEIVPKYSGILTPHRRLLFSSAGGGTLPKLEIGDSGATFGYAGPSGQPLFQIFANSSLTIELINNQVEVSTQIRDKSGHFVAELVRNVWKVTPPPGTWDRNYTDDALEVKDARGRIVLQVRALPDRIQLQGEWWNEQGDGLRIVKRPDLQPGVRGGLLQPLTRNSDPDEPRIEPLFEYPSDQHFGQLKPKP